MNAIEIRVFKTKWFQKWTIKEGLSDSALINAVNEIKQGLVEADLGGYVYKKRVKLPGRGKRSGARTLLAYRRTKEVYFVYGYAKNQSDSIEDKQLQALKILAGKLLEFTEDDILHSIKNGELIEVGENG